MSIDFDPIIADLVGKSRYPVIKLSSGLYAAVSAITDSGATTKQIYYGDEIGGLPAEVKIYGTVTQWH